MKVRGTLGLVFITVFMASPASSVRGQTDAIAGPKFHNLRYEEDFSYLGGEPGTYRKDIWDPLKWIDLGDDWYLTLGGQARLRFESEQNKAFGSVEPTQDASCWIAHLYTGTSSMASGCVCCSSRSE